MAQKVHAISHLKKAFCYQKHLLLKLMSTCPIVDLEFEALIKNIRSEISIKISKKDYCSGLLKLQSALALQCFTNEYLYIESYRYQSS